MLTVRALGPGRVELTSLEALLAKHRGRMRTDGGMRRLIEEMRDEWS